MEFLGIVLDTLLIVLVIVLIILSLKAIDTLTKIDAILIDTKKKLESFDNIFLLADTINDKLLGATETIISSVVAFIKSLFEKKRKGDIDE